MPVSRMPAIVGRLVEEAREATDVEQVFDGPHLGQLMSDVLVLGFTESADRPGYESRVTRQEGAGRPRLIEAFVVRCLVSTASGDTDEAAVANLRNRCGKVLADLDEHLRDLGPVTGLWSHVALTGDTEWIPLQDQDGAAMNVIFTIEGAALL